MNATPLLTTLIAKNPNDNLGARYVLMQALLDTGGWTKVATLFRSYPDDVEPDIAYSGGRCTTASWRDGKRQNWA